MNVALWYSAALLLGVLVLAVMTAVSAAREYRRDVAAAYVTARGPVDESPWPPEVQP